MENKLKNFFTPVIYSLFVVFISLWNFDSYEVKSPPISDKFIHFLIYFLFVIFWANSFKNRFKNSTLFVFFFSLLFGLILEFVQINLSYRSFEFFDLISNFIGCLVGYLIVKITLEKH
ncbi:MAG: hypothetical protein CBE13_001400 [Candidatus Pelagibacter sp. TMED253]|nr:MAG: hypothetical protein CBE13_001400 [Candidatus Pelagibacter sp. TMED253]